MKRGISILIIMFLALGACAQTQLGVVADSEKNASQKLKDVAQECYSLFELKKLQHDYDSASYYITTRARLDTTNVQWQLDAGVFLAEYLLREDDYESQQAIEDQICEYYNRALSYAESLYGNDSPIVGTCYLRLGDMIDCYADPRTDSLENYHKALEIMKHNFGDNSIQVADCYRRIGAVYGQQFNYITRINPFFDQAEYYTKKALEIYKTHYGEYHCATAICYAETGEVDYFYEDTFPYFEKALAILDSLGNGVEVAKAEVYIKIAGYYYSGVDKSRSADMQAEMLDGQYFIEKSTDDQGHYEYKEFSSEERTHFENWQNTLIAISESRLEDYSAALQYYEKALSIYTHEYGERHPRVVYVNNRIQDIKSDVEFEKSAIEKAKEHLKLLEGK